MGEDTILFENFGQNLEPNQIIFSEGDPGDRRHRRGLWRLY